jgi:hypothetical protein
MTIPATNPQKKLKAARSYAMSPRNYLCASRVGDREGTGEALTEWSPERRMMLIILS